MIGSQGGVAGATGNPTSAPFTECPAVNADTSCAILVVVTNTGTQILQDSSQQPFDGVEDTLIGVLNNSSHPLNQLQLSSASVGLFGFDGDGLCTYASGGQSSNGTTGSGFHGDSYCSSSQKAGTDPQDYQGPDNTFSGISSDQMRGTVNFSTPLATGQSTYFSLENTLSTSNFGIQSGYWEVASDGGLFAFGNAGFYGSMGGKPLNAPIVGMDSTPDAQGYWEVASDGGLFAFGDANFYGSMGGKPLNAPIVGITATSDGGGYFEVASDGGLFAFGDANFYGSMGGKPLNAPIVGITATPDGGGYWEVASDGGLFAFGNAGFYGSMGGQPLDKPIIGMATPDSAGYWEAAADGGLFAFGDANFYGSMGGQPLNQPVVGIAAVK